MESSSEFAHIFNSFLLERALCACSFARSLFPSMLTNIWCYFYVLSLHEEDICQKVNSVWCYPASRLMDSDSYNRVRRNRCFSPCRSRRQVSFITPIVPSNISFSTMDFMLLARHTQQRCVLTSSSPTARPKISLIRLYSPWNGYLIAQQQSRMQTTDEVRRTARFRGT